MEPVKKNGRPTKYDPSWMKDKMIEVASNGGFLAAICCELGISIKTHYNWLNDHPDYNEAYAEAYLHNLAFCEKNTIDGALGKIPGFNATAMALVLNNKHKSEYARGTGSHTEINFNSLTTLTDEQLKLKLQDLAPKFLTETIIDITPTDSTN